MIFAWFVLKVYVGSMGMKDKYRYIHLMPAADSIFNVEFVKFVNMNFAPEEHLFVIFSSKALPVFDEYRNVIIKDRLNLDVFNQIAPYSDSLFVHGLAFSAWELIRMRKEYARKIIWCVWGHDLYRYSWGDAIKEHFSLKNLARWIYVRFLKLIWKLVDRKIACFKAGVASFIKDCQLLKKRYPSLTVYNAVYPFGHYLNELQSLECSCPKRRILLGHSAFPFLKHEKYLYLLQKYLHEDFQLVIPLTYGVLDYADRIEKKAKEIYGDRALVIRESLSWIDYAKLLKTIDVAIFDYRHQSALGNIYLLLYLGKKIYLSGNGLIYNGLSDIGEGKNVKVYDCSDVGKVSYGQFMFEHSEAGEGVEYARQFFDKSIVLAKWREIFK